MERPTAAVSTVTALWKIKRQAHETRRHTGLVPTKHCPPLHPELGVLPPQSSRAARRRETLPAAPEPLPGGADGFGHLFSKRQRALHRQIIPPAPGAAGWEPAGLRAGTRAAPHCSLQPCPPRLLPAPIQGRKIPVGFPVPARGAARTPALSAHAADSVSITEWTPAPPAIPPRPLKWGFSFPGGIFF